MDKIGQIPKGRRNGFDLVSARPCRRNHRPLRPREADIFAISAPRPRNLRVYVLMPLVELVRLPNGAEAELLRGRLESAGVHAVCFDAGMNIAESVGLLIPVRVMVLDEDLDEARALMTEFEGGGNGTAA